MFTQADGGTHPHAISQSFNRIVAGADVPRILLHDVRHTQATLLIKAGVPVKVVSERFGRANPAFTIETYQHVLPGMQADAAQLFEGLVAGRSRSLTVNTLASTQLTRPNGGPTETQREPATGRT